MGLPEGEDLSKMCTVGRPEAKNSVKHALWAAPQNLIKLVLISVILHMKGQLVVFVFIYCNIEEKFESFNCYIMFHHHT